MEAEEELCVNIHPIVPHFQFTRNAQYKMVIRRQPVEVGNVNLEPTCGESS